MKPVVRRGTNAVIGIQYAYHVAPYTANVKYPAHVIIHVTVVVHHALVDIPQQDQIICVQMIKNGFPVDIIMTVEIGVGEVEPAID